jgi:diaminopimelate decarboxylase
MVFSEKRILENYNQLLKSFSKYYKNISVHYSVKTNFEPKILRIIKNAGAKTEIASAMEFWIAKKAGILASDIIVDGPAWSDEEIELFIREGCKTLNADSEDMMKRINVIAKKLKKKVRVGYRIALEIKTGFLKSFIENHIDKFGIPLSEGIKLYKEAKKFNNIDLISISTHIGSMMTNPVFYEEAVDKLLKLTAQLRDQLGIHIGEVNLGGGFGVRSLDYYPVQNIILEKAGLAYYKNSATIEEFGFRISKRFKENLAKYSLENINLIIEPGRFIVSDSAILITSVRSVKRKWIFLDGGANVVAESIFFIRRNFMVTNKLSKPKTARLNIAGPTLNTADILATDYNLPTMTAGDTVVIFDTGAYSLSRSNQFTSLRPTVVLIDNDNKKTLLRKKEEISDLLKQLII